MKTMIGVVWSTGLSAKTVCTVFYFAPDYDRSDVLSSVILVQKLNLIQARGYAIVISVANGMCWL